MIKTRIQDPKTGKEVTVDDNNALRVTESGVPPESLNVVLKPFSEFMVDSSDSQDMLVNGSSSSVDFIIRATNDGDRYIQTLAITIADAGATLNKFGNINALSNGCQLIYQDADLGDVIIGDALKSNFDFVQLCNFEPTFGTGVDAFRAKNVESNSEAYIPLLDLTDVFGVPYGLRLPKGTTKSLILRIRDNVSNIDRFDVKCFGFDRISTEE